MFRGIALILMVGLLCSAIHGAGIGSTASTIKVRAAPGSLATKRSLRLINPDGYAKRFMTSLRLSKEGKGYMPIEELDWAKVSPGTVAVAGKSRSEPIEFSVLIPDSLEYYNRRFSCDIEISQATSGALATGLVIPVFIDTEPTWDIPKRCAGCKLVAYPHRLSIVGKLDSMTIVNWGDDTAKVAVGWNNPGQQSWRDALMLLENIMGGVIPIPDTMAIPPNGRRRILIKPFAYPGRGKLYFHSENCGHDYIELNWKEQ